MNKLIKFFLINSLCGVLILSVAAIYTISELHEEAIVEQHADLDRCLQTFWLLLKQKGEDFRIVDNKLLAGNYVINGNYELPDKVQKIFGGTATIFMGNIRVSTNILKQDGSRAIGTTLTGAAYNSIFEQGKPYRGETLILDTPYFTAYDPIRNSQGEIIGVLYVGVKKSEFVARFLTLRFRIITIFAVLIACFGAIAFLLARTTQRMAFERERHLNFLQTIIDTIPLPVFAKDEQGFYTACNTSFERYCGKTRQEILGRAVHDIVPAEYADEYRQADEALIAQGPGIFQMFEGAARYADGSRRDVIFSKAAFAKPDGTIGGIVGTFVDITDRKQSERALLEQKEFSENLVQNSAIPAFVLDSQRRVLFWNRALEELTGIKGEDIIGTSNYWQAFYPEEHPCLADFILDEKLSLGCVEYRSVPSHLIPDGLQAEGWYPNLNGRDRYILFNAAPIKNSAGKILAVIETIEDLTAFKQSLEALSEATEFQKAILNNIPDIAWLKDKESRFLACNVPFAEACNVPLEELPGKTDMDIWPHELAEKYRADDLEVMAQGIRKQVEEPLIDNTGKTRIIETIKTPVRNAQGEIIGTTGIARDITERKTLENELRHAQKMEAIGTLAGGIAHDFNNILTTIAGYASIIKDNLEDDNPLIPSIDQILAGTQQASSLTRNLLAYSRKQTLNPFPVDINAIATKMDKFLSRIIGEEVKLSTITTDSDLTVLADSGQIEQVLMNLAVNARDALEGKQGEVLITTDRVELGQEFINSYGYGKAGAYAAISVKDTGSGMSKEIRDRIFEPFFTTKELGKGTGLGLAIVYGIIKQHGGYIVVDSEVKQGTTFSIYLPLYAGSSIQPEIQEKASDTGAEGIETILLVEDAKEVRQLLTKVLEQAGYTVIQAIDGMEGSTRFKENRQAIKLVLSDIIMPHKNGKELYEEIRSIDPNMKVLFISGYAGDLLSRRGIDESRLPVLQKPFSPKTLLSKVREKLDQQ